MKVNLIKGIFGKKYDTFSENGNLMVRIVVVFNNPDFVETFDTWTDDIILESRTNLSTCDLLHIKQRLFTTVIAMSEIKYMKIHLLDAMGHERKTLKHPLAFCSVEGCLSSGPTVTVLNTDFIDYWTNYGLKAGFDYSRAYEIYPRIKFIKMEERI